ncbi:MAG: type IV secretion system DNA-binding domain-containing protein [Actinomycetota bacterium]|nr:type IV secretion system DNA-binding domain-containing protein [Actinomycetota bacterium]
MIELLVAIAVIGGLSIAGLLGVRESSRRRWQDNLVAYALRLPRGLEASDVAAVLVACTGLRASKLRRPFSVRAIVLEVTATSDGIVHHLFAPAASSDIVLAALRAAAPGIAIGEDELYSRQQTTIAAEIGQSGWRKPLVTGQAERISTAILASLQPLINGERIVMQWVISPTAPLTQPKIAAAGHGRGDPALMRILKRLVTTPPVDAHTAKAIRSKQSSPLFVASGRVGAVASSRGRARALVSRTLAATHTANAPGAHLYRSWWPSGLVQRWLYERSAPLLRQPCLLNADELAGLIAWPLGDVSLPGLSLGGTRALAPSSDIPQYGRVVLHSTYPGMERPLALSVPDSLRHLHAIGPTGVGKSTLLLGLITQDMQAGRGVVVVDPKGDLVSEVLDRVPPERTGDVVLLDPADEERPVGLNLLVRPGESPELVVDQVVSIFHDLYRDSWGPRTDDILRAALLTLVGVPGMTLTEVPLLLTDPSFRGPLVGRLNDPVALGPFWGWYEGLSDGERMQAIGPVMNKLRTFLLRRRLRNILGQAEPVFDFDQALANRDIVLVPLTKGLLGEEAAGLLGSLVVTRLWQAVQGRAGLHQSERPVTFAYIDEFQDYLHLPVGVEAMLTQARGLGLGLTLAHQHLGQLPASVREAVLANAGSRAIFQVAASDAQALARELAPEVKAADLQGLGRFEVVARLSAGGLVARPVTGTTLAAPPTTGQAAAARLRSRMRYGVDRAEVEAAIQARYTARPGGRSVGKRRRS